jgi:D-glycero-D-manno-heptose 1,7-bisphosphate phosphatase
LRRAVFLDRDGTLNTAPPVGLHIRDPGQLELLPGAARAVRAINASGALAVLFSNQRWLCRPAVPATAIATLHERLAELLGEAGARLDAYYVCPHEVGACDCRKPAAGMLRRAAADLDIDLRRSVAIGDSASDVAAGRAAGTRCALLCGGDPALAALAAPDAVFSDLGEAVAWAL